jgi:hypothetical protein
MPQKFCEMIWSWKLSSSLGACLLDWVFSAFHMWRRLNLAVGFERLRKYLLFVVWIPPWPSWAFLFVSSASADYIPRFMVILQLVASFNPTRIMHHSPQLTPTFVYHSFREQSCLRNSHSERKCRLRTVSEENKPTGTELASLESSFSFCCWILLLLKNLYSSIGLVCT